MADPQKNLGLFNCNFVFPEIYSEVGTTGLKNKPAVTGLSVLM
jgi:hypothetical protein